MESRNLGDMEELMFLIMNICRLNRSSKVCMKKSLARNTRTPPSSLPKSNTFFQRILSRRNSIPEPELDN